MDQKLDFFEGRRVDETGIKFTGSPDCVIDKTELGAPVAFLVTGTVDEIGFPRTKDGHVVREHKIKMRRVLQVSYEDGLAMLDEIDRKNREAQGIHELPFDEED